MNTVHEFDALNGLDKSDISFHSTAVVKYQYDTTSIWINLEPVL